MLFKKKLNLLVHSSLFGGAGVLVSIKVCKIYPWLGLPQGLDSNPSVLCLLVQLPAIATAAKLIISDNDSN